ncbi:phosphate/phosphite/phosphonate ABC transporter substrate-binding protein [Rubrobacter tropicus]|uniref:Phosphate/phosphite/phosphonate ABC transporter substrate-binding protein n=1 Tax=Rubrobacter tropicus TaxID=2653851 RepID=A0A6G8QAU0_9ACTN|nr:phosphate/phosphite/phosphonate ABC transporter substrate-binding protein [Rubrobacter tropicus]QIN83579.1 phosphate/phosphite/phosphonate ABC transporter substrate-binding protein [Rubrobacter tropicus]
MIHRLSTPILVAVAAIVFAGCGGSGSASGDEPLRVGLIPNENPEEVEAQYQPLEDYLKKETGGEVELSVPTTYNAVVEAMVSGELDLAYFGGLTYVQARQRADVHPLFTEVNPRTGTTKYRSVIIVPSGSDVEKVEDLEGEDFAFGSVSSTSGSLYPSIMLNQAGIDYRTDLGEVVYTGGHDTTAQAVANGRVAAGGLEDRILYDLREEGIIEKGSVRVIEKSDPIEGYPWVVRDALPDKDEQELTDAFLGIEDPELLDLLRAEDYQRVRAGDYDYVEEQARKLDLIAEEQ